MYQYEWLPGGLVQPTQLEAFAKLYSEHYGIWGEMGPNPQGHVRLTAARVREWFTPGSLVVWATAMGELVGYAIAIQTNLQGYGSIAWVTQLVVHEEHRQRDVGKTLLFSIWRFTDHFAWGVLSANPYAVRALEKATRRRCSPVRIKVNVKQLVQLGRRTVPYLNESTEVVATSTESRIDTKFFLDHSQLTAMLTAVVQDENPWRLGPLPEGWEWFAFTFKDQPQIGLSQYELDEMLAASDQVTREAYSRMPMHSESHAWAKYGTVEAEFIIENCHLTERQTVVDFGCGHGRHNLELAARGIITVGVDYIKSFIYLAQKEASVRALSTAQFVEGDCRIVDLEQVFDVGICLYDVIGSYADESNNLAILENIVKHVKPGGFILLSVMNMGLTERIAKNWFSISSEADKLLSLTPSAAMEESGEVFNPDFYMIDKDTGIVYRKEQFKDGYGLPEEFIVRDRRYTQAKIKNHCRAMGLDVIWSRFVKAGKWNEELAEDSDRAKEILLLCQKPGIGDLQGKLF